MSDDDGQYDTTQQISVAELLARNGQQAPKREGGRRRGRPGGISVAELTGDLPIIRETDTGSIHAVLPSEAEVDEAGAAAVAVPEASYSEPVLTQAAPKRKRPEVEITQVDADQPQAWSSAEREPELLSGGTRAGELLRTRSEPVDAPADVDRGVAFSGAAKDTAAKDAAAAAKADAAAAAKAEAAAAKADAAAAKAAKKDAAAAAKKAVAAEKAAAGAEPAKRPSNTAAENAAATSDEPSAGRQWLVLGGQAVVAIVAGALLFKGFEELWVSMQWIALALAVVVIVGLVAVVRILRKTDDMFSLVIAIAVGLFVTLGPLVFVLSTGRG